MRFCLEKSSQAQLAHKPRGGRPTTSAAGPSSARLRKSDSLFMMFHGIWPIISSQFMPFRGANRNQLGKRRFLVPPGLFSIAQAGIGKGPSR